MRCTVAGRAYALVMAVAACGGGGDKVTGNGGNGGTPNYSIVLAASPTDVSIPIGESRQVTLTVTRGGNYGGIVTFGVERLPSYVEATFNPPSAGGTATTTSVLTLTTTAESPTGVYSIMVRASGNDVTTQRVSLNCSLVVVPRIGVALGTATVAVTKGSSATVPVSLSRSGSFAGSVNLTVDGAPDGLTAAFAPNPAGGSTSVLTLSAASTLAPNDYPVTVHATATGVADATAPLVVTVSDAPSYSLSVDPTSVTVTPPATATVKVKIERTGGFTGAINLFPEGFPAGVTATIAPFPAAGNDATMTLVVPEATSSGSYEMFVRGEAVGQPSRKAPVTLTVEAPRSFTLHGPSGPITLVTGGSEQGVNIGIERTGGFDGEVSFTATGVPTGFTVRFSSSTTTGTGTTVFLSAGASVVPGTATIQVVGSAVGMANRTATILINVVAGGTAITWRFCSGSSLPVFFAYADGASLFTEVPQSFDGSYRFSIATGRGTVLFVLPEFTPLETDRLGRPRSGWPVVSRTARGGLAPRAALSSGYTTSVSYATTAELQQMAQPDCPPSSITKSLTGSVAGVPSDQAFGVALGTSLAVGDPGEGSTFTLTGVPDGPHDLLAARLVVGGTSDDETLTPNKLIVRRALNPVSGSVLPVLDFNAAEAFDPVTAAVTVTGANGASIRVTSAFSTANGTNTFLAGATSGGGASQTFWGLPISRLVAGDLHWAIASDDRGRNAAVFSHEVVPRTVSLGPEMPAPVVGVFATTPTFRVHALLNNLGPADTQYGGSFDVTFSQPSLQRALVFTYSRGAIATSNNVEVRTPVLTNIPSWNESLYGLRIGSQIIWEVNAWSVADTFVPTDGALLRWTTFAGNVTP